MKPQPAPPPSANPRSQRGALDRARWLIESGKHGRGKEFDRLLEAWPEIEEAVQRILEVKPATNASQIDLDDPVFVERLLNACEGRTLTEVAAALGVNYPALAQATSNKRHPEVRKKMNERGLNVES